MHPRKLIRESVLFATAQYVVRLGLMLRGVVAARLLGPEVYGAWNALLLIMAYGGQSNLGTYEGVDQTAPGRILEGDPERLTKLKRAAIFNGVFFPLLFGAGVLLYLMRGGGVGKIVGFWGVGGVVAALVVVLLTSIAYVHLSLLRAHDRIPVVTTWFLVQGGIGVALGLGLIPWLGAWGLLWGWLTGTLLAIVYVRWRAPGLVPLAPRPSTESTRLLRVGSPMFVYGASYFVTRTLDRVFILRFLGTLELGYYSLTVMALTLLMYLPDSVTYVLYPQLLRDFHASGGTPESIRSRVERAAQAISLFVPMLCGVAYLAALDVVTHVLPSFLPGVPVVRIMVFGAGGLALAGLSAIVLMTMGRRHILIPVSLGITGLTAVLDYTAIRMDGGITGIAAVTACAYLLNGSVLFTIAMRRFHDTWRGSLLAVGRGLAPLGIAAVVAVLIDFAVPAAPPASLALAILRLVFVIAAFKLVYMMAVRPLARGLGVKQLLREFRIPWPNRDANGTGG